MRHLKEKPDLNKSDVIELFDRSKMALVDLMQIAVDKNFRIEIDITEQGDIDFIVTENCVEKDYTMHLSKGVKRTSFTESESDRVF